MNVEFTGIWVAHGADGHYRVIVGTVKANQLLESQGFFDAVHIKHRYLVTIRRLKDHLVKVEKARDHRK